MKTKIFGAFNADHSHDNRFANTRNTKLPKLIVLDQTEICQNNQLTCYVWGNFYDLEKSCKDLKIPASDNPADLISTELDKGNYTCAKDFYGEFTYFYITPEKIIIGRDLAGAGLPVFYSKDYFSNSIDELINTGDYRDYNFQAIQSFLHLGTLLPSETILNGIKQLHAGEYLVYQKGKITGGNVFPFEKYYKLVNSRNISEFEAVRELEKLHKKSLKRRIEGRKNISLLMSGGYDSGGNVAAIRDITDDRISGFSVGFKDDDWSELPLTKLLAKKYNIDLYEYLIDGSEIYDLPVIMNALGMPFNENGLMVNYAVMKMIDPDWNGIILGGDGNDQIYGTNLQYLTLHHFISKFGLTHFQTFVNRMISGSRNAFLSRIYFHSYRTQHVLDYPHFGFNRSELKKLLRIHSDDFNTNICMRNEVESHSFDDDYRIFTYFKDFLHECNNLIIFKASSMARLFKHHLSFPYMDKDYVDFVFSLPIKLRFHGTRKELLKGDGVSKYLHKKYLEPKLPHEITHRKKQGGFVPLSIFFSNEEQRKIIFQIIRKSPFIKDLFNDKYVEKFIYDFNNEFTSPNTWFWQKQSNAFQLLNLLTLIVWLEIHINKQRISDLRSMV